MHGRTVADYRDDCARGEIWIAELSGEVVGFSHGVPGEVKRLFVKEAAIGLGIGAELMKRALSDARNGVTEVIIDATLNAAPFYERWGFRRIGTGVFPGRDGLPPIEIVHMTQSF
jgi:putative acetyltransferase